MATFCVSRVEFGRVNFKMVSVLASGNEDDCLMKAFIEGAFDENLSLAYWMYLAENANYGDLFLDVGAYAGLFSFVAAGCNRKLKVAAFEAAAVTFGRLVDNIRYNGFQTTVCAANYAAWKDSSTLKFGHRYGVYNMCPGESALGNQEMDHTEDVFAIRLDCLIGDGTDLPGPLGSKALGVRGYKKIKAMKIDVEGAEGAVLSGSTALIEMHRPIIVCELLTANAISKITEFVDQFRYSVHPIANERNFLLCPSEQLDELQTGFLNWSRQGSLLPKVRGWRHLMIET